MADTYTTIARAINYIRQQAFRQPSLAEIAAAVGLSEYHLQRTFRTWTGVSPKRFLQFLTKEYALSRLHESGDLLNLSLDIGLSGPGRLHDLMVTCEAMTPGEIRRGGEGVSLDFGLAESPFGPVLIAWSNRGICHLSFHETADLPVQALLRDAKIVSYSTLARLAGQPKAQRSVGTALAANRLAYLIPCHRVIRGTGEVGAYHWGSTRKLAILAWEAAQADITKP
ncbi:MAG: methylated-DNA--[protein]-cysteine S-methyltransferase [Candidatus Thiodiazotropha sp.]